MLEIKDEKALEEINGGGWGQAISATVGTVGLGIAGGMAGAAALAGAPAAGLAGLALAGAGAIWNACN